MKSGRQETYVIKRKISPRQRGVLENCSRFQFAYCGRKDGGKESIDNWFEWFKSQDIPCAIENRNGDLILWRKGSRWIVPTQLRVDERIFGKIVRSYRWEDDKNNF